MDLSKWINVVLDRDTHKRLGQAGAKGDSYNDIVIKLLDNYDAVKNNKIDKDDQASTQL